jgi:hypothetical protein
VIELNKGGQELKVFNVGTMRTSLSLAMSNLPGDGSNDIEPNVETRSANTGQMIRHEHGERDEGSAKEVEKEVGHSTTF